MCTEQVTEGVSLVLAYDSIRDHRNAASGSPNSSKRILEILAGSSSGTMWAAEGISLSATLGLKKLVTKLEWIGTGKRLSFPPQITTRLPGNEVPVHTRIG